MTKKPETAAQAVPAGEPVRAEPETEGARAETGSAERAAPTFEVKLLKPHTHEGAPKRAGETIRVTARQRTTLVGWGVIEAPREA